MGFNGGSGFSVSMEDIDTVVMVTGFLDKAMITTALQGNHGNVETVINEYLDDADKFRRKYGWDESAFSSGRDGDATPGNNANVPSFTIHPPVTYGVEPTNLWNAPSRPPSRANNRSPMSRLADIAAGEYTTDTPSNRQEEEDQLQRAINESLGTSGVQSPHAFPPPPPPLPQQSGVTTNNEDSSVYFGPANRPDYEPDEWAMVPLGNQESDPDPSLRARQAGTPVLLRCRQLVNWKKHRLGALLMIYQQVPAARNALLQIGQPPGYGYGNKGDWWQGQPIYPPGRCDPNGWADDSCLSWTDELHRLMGFLEATERTYGTADILARARHPELRETGDAEKDFFQNFSQSPPAEGVRDQRDTLMSAVELVAYDDLNPQGADSFGLLDLPVNKDAVPLHENIYQVLDWVFLVDLKLAREDPSAARMAWVTQASDVLTCRFQGDAGFHRPVEIPETFYLDRYMKTNREKLRELQADMVTLYKAFEDNMQKERNLIGWFNPKTRKTYDRRTMAKAAAGRCQEKIRRIRQRAFWRQHEQASPNGDGEYYLPEHGDEPSLLPDEAKVVAHYEAKIRELEDKMVEMERTVKEHLLPEKQAIDEINRKMSTLLTVPSADEKWNPKYKYTLRGVANDPNIVYLRMRGPIGESEAAPARDAPGPAEERWWRVSFRTEDNTVEHTPVDYETVMREACGAGCLPIAVFATDNAMAQESVPLPDALRTFVRLDNRHFKQEQSQSNRMGHKRSAGLGDGSQSKRLQRSASMDSMDTNHASAGDLDDDMRDAPFDNDSAFGAIGDHHPALDNTTSGQDEDIPDLIDISPPPAQAAPSSPLPAYENHMELDTGVSPALAQVSLQDIKRSSPPRVQEMQERPNAMLLTRPGNSSNGGVVNGGGVANGTAPSTTTAAVDEEEPLIDLSDGPDPGMGTRVNGA